ncbi:phospholipid/cholesterol/gamma-HCH transport system substrate-binding protein [Nocardioides cavernae]|uniref:Phospholipid/cholesterol/gamma-HCH transport system substrate-binding protein n=1 Tax=Nocardioides cavernae TaxID=1921566 RepID=A0A7Y9H4F1_9ACTN|nr:MlaD family protein [Nocardioides cavernae]NYE37029.1 phospholipid/cholesterol/gamma-HCH transport system substrate-binding protein [Nocardioides cavernae]
MITRRTRVQLLVFALITLVGVSFVGARYARLDRLVSDQAYTVVAHFAESGGAFAGAEVSYRGVRVGEVRELVLTDDGVDLVLDIDDEHEDIPADADAVVGNRSAVGEQYVELQPRSDDGPYLREGSEIARDRTAVPIRTDTLLTHLDETVRSVDQDDLRTVTSELGTAFEGAGGDLQTILDSSNELITAADQNFDVTVDLIRDANTVLDGQVDSESAFRRFARDLSSFTTTVADHDADLRALIEDGSLGADELRVFLEQNEVELGDLINNLVTTGEVVVTHLDGIEQLLVIYPYVVEGGFTVVSKSPGTGLYDAHFGLVLTMDPKVCLQGYEGTDRRSPLDGSTVPMDEDAGCTAPASQTNARGAQNIQSPRAATGWGQADLAYDPETGVLATDPDEIQRLLGRSAPAPRTLGDDSWKWLYLQPLLAGGVTSPTTGR